MSFLPTTSAPPNPETLAAALAPLLPLRTAAGALSYALKGNVTVNPSPYLPRRGEQVRVVAVCPSDPLPYVSVGSEVTVDFAAYYGDESPPARARWEDLGIPTGEWILMRTTAHRPGCSTWCRVEALPPLEWAALIDEE